MVPKPKKKETEAYKWRNSEEKNFVKVVKIKQRSQRLAFWPLYHIFPIHSPFCCVLLFGFCCKVCAVQIWLLIKSKRTLLWNFIPSDSLAHCTGIFILKGSAHFYATKFWHFWITVLFRFVTPHSVTDTELMRITIEI